MKEKILLSFVCFFVWQASSHAKTTYIPTYRSYIHIVTNGDTISNTGIQTWTELRDGNGMFAVAIEHEEVTREKVKAVKRAKAAAGWAAFASIMSGVSTAFSDNSLQYYVRSTNTKLTAELANMYEYNATLEQTLGISVWLLNTSDYELMINDMERGLTWYIMPGEEKEFVLHNPDAACLRISDTKNEQVRYVLATGGSTMKKHNIGWEDDDCWITENYTNYNYESDMEFSSLESYTHISKSDFSTRKMTIEEFKEWKKSHNKK